MNQLLQEAFERAATLPDEDQDRLARVLLEEIESDRRWDELFASPESQAFFEKIADEVREDIRAGRTEPLRLEDL